MKSYNGKQTTTQKTKNLFKIRLRQKDKSAHQRPLLLLQQIPSHKNTNPRKNITTRRNKNITDNKKETAVKWPKRNLTLRLLKSNNVSNTRVLV